MTDRRPIRLSKPMSLVLRHEPERFGVVLDAEGFASLAELLEAVRARIPGASELDVRAVVDTVEPEKQRFSIVAGEIRANRSFWLADRVPAEYLAETE